MDSEANAGTTRFGPILIDAFASVTTPRRGVLSIFDDQNDQGVDYSLPVPLEPLISFLQVRVDPDDAWRGYYELNGDDGNKTFALIDRWCELTYSSTDGAHDRRLGYFGASDVEQYVGNFLGRYGGKFDHLEESDIEAYYPKLAGSDRTIVGMGPKGRERQIARWQRNFKLLDEDDKIAEAANDTARLELNERSRQHTRTKIEEIKTAAPEVSFVMLGDWRIVHPIDETIEQLFQQHPRQDEQLTRLKEVVADTQKHFGIRRREDAVFCYWSQSLLVRPAAMQWLAWAFRSGDPADELAPSRLADDKKEETNRPQGDNEEVDELRKKLANHLDGVAEMLVLIVTNTERGFRINGVVSRPKSMQEVPRSKETTDSDLSLRDGR